MQDKTKVKLVLLAFLMLPVAFTAGNENGFKQGVASIDEESFQAYVHFARPMQAEVRAMKKAPAKDVFAAAGF